MSTYFYFRPGDGPGSEASSKSARQSRSQTGPPDEARRLVSLPFLLQQPMRAARPSRPSRDWLRTLKDQPVVLATDERAAKLELLQREGDRRAPRAHEQTDGAMGEPDREHDTVWGGVSPCLSQQPHQCEDTILHAWQLADEKLHQETLLLIVGAHLQTLDQSRVTLDKSQHTIIKRCVPHRAADGEVRARHES